MLLDEAKALPFTATDFSIFMMPFADLSPVTQVGKATSRPTEHKSLPLIFTPLLRMESIMNFVLNASLELDLREFFFIIIPFIKPCDNIVTESAKTDMPIIHSINADPLEDFIRRNSMTMLLFLKLCLAFD